MKPVSLLKDAEAKKILSKASKGTKYGYILYSSIALLAWWFPNVALTISVMTWIYWLYLGSTMKYPHQNDKK